MYVSMSAATNVRKNRAFAYELPKRGNEKRGAGWEEFNTANYVGKLQVKQRVEFESFNFSLVQAKKYSINKWKRRAQGGAKTFSKALATTTSPMVLSKNVCVSVCVRSKKGAKHYNRAKLNTRTKITIYILTYMHASKHAYIHTQPYEELLEYPAQGNEIKAHTREL